MNRHSSAAALYGSHPSGYGMYFHYLLTTAAGGLVPTSILRQVVGRPHP